MTAHTILVAPGDRELATTLTMMLTRAGHNVPPAISGPEDLPAAVELHHPELLLFDLDRPTAWDLSDLPLPVVYLADSPRHPSLSESAHLVLKPVLERELIATVQLALTTFAHQTEWSALVANVPGIVCRREHRPPWRMEQLSQHVLAITGRPAAEFLEGQTSWADLVIPDDLAHVAGDLDAAIANRQPFHLEYRIRHLDGGVRWVQDSGNCHYHASGEPSHLDAVILDSTARHRSEADIEREEAESRAIHDEAPVMLCALDGDQRIIYANREFTRFAGQSKDQLRGNSLCSALNCESGSDAAPCDLCNALSDTLLTGAAHHGIVIQTKLEAGGSSRQVRLAVSTALVSAPGPTRLLLSLSDVTAREAAFQGWLPNEERYRTLVENAGEAVIVAQSGMFRYVNAAAERLLGRTREELNDTPLAGLIHPDDRTLVLQRHSARHTDPNLPSSYPFRLLNRDGGTVWVRLNVVPVEWDGQQATLNLLSDITGQIQSESDYTTLFQSMLDGFALAELILDPDGQPIDFRFLNVNPAFERMTGLDATRIIGRSASEILPGLESHWLDAFARVVLTGTPARLQNRAAQLKKWFEVYAYRPKDGQFACVVQDITERKQMQDALVFLVECGYLKTGESFFQSLARYLADNLEMDYVCIDRLVGDGLLAQTVAVFSNGEFQDNVTYALRDTPCGDVVGKAVCCFPRDVCELFPNDEVLSQLGAESYAGTTLWGFHGEPVGLIAVISRKPLVNPGFVESVLKLVAVRAAGELEREHAENALRESEDRHRSVLTASPDGIVIADLDGCVRLASPKALELLRVTRMEDVIGRHLTEFVMPEDRQDGLANLALLSQGVAGGPFEYRAVRADASVFDIEINAELTCGQDGQPTGFVLVCRDVSERKQVEAALRASEDQHRTLVSNLSSGVVVHGPDTAILLANPMASKLLGLTGDQMRGKTALDPAWRFIQEDGSTLPLDRYPVNQVLATGQSISNFAAGVLSTISPEPTWLLCDAYPVLAADGSIVQVVVTFTDITERKRTEARLVHAQKMESVGRLAGGIAHDFNNLLTVINGYSLMILDKMNPLDPMRIDVEAILKAGERAASLTGKILAFSRKQMLQLRVLDLNLAVSELLPLLARLLGADIDIVANLSPDPALVSADPHQLEQVLMNLAVNARDAMPAGGKLVIETSGVTWTPELARQQPDARPGRYILLTVSDDGTGMDEATRQRIFEPFFTTKGVGQGTGLGLSMVQGIVAQSGGFVEVRTGLGAGATFRIFLPRVDDAQDHTAPVSKRRVRGGNESILLVEDQPEVRAFAGHALQHYGYRVTPVQDAAEAIQAFQHAPAAFDLILTDVVMPGLSGRELFDRLRALRPDIKFLFMSGYAGNAIQRHGIQLGGQHFIQKPFSPDHLADRVRSTLNAR